MKFSIPNSLFVRFFILLFVILSISFFASREIFFLLGLEQPAPSAANPRNSILLNDMLILMAAVGITAWVAAIWLSKPIKRLAEAAEELGKNLNSAYINETSGPSEVRQASRVFNQMQSRLKQQLDERNRFLAAVSHDLRTPLTRLKLRAEKIEQPELRSDVQNDINDMAYIIVTTLQYIRGKEQPEESCMLDITALVQSLAEDAKEAGDIVSVSGNAIPIRIQPISIQRCLSNLIENALRYGEKAEIFITESDENVTISVHDTGPGIPEDKLEEVFKPFYRLENSRSRHTGGVGLGLSIARDMAIKQGGNISLRNDPHGGLIAELTLPKMVKEIIE
jgi:signal transduction histidine kinase